MADPSTILIWDLDKTYLDTRFESLGAMLKIPFETADDKKAFRSVSFFLKELMLGFKAAGAQPNLTFISASPPWIRKTIFRKFALDGVAVDAIITKNLVRLIRPGRLNLLRNHMLYKLEHLLMLAHNNPGARYFCFGDDWEYDLLIYMVFRDIVLGRMPRELIQFIFDSLGLPSSWLSRYWVHMAPFLSQPLQDGSVRIFVHRVRFRELGIIQVAGQHVIGFDSYVQIAARAISEGWIARDGAHRLFRAAAEEWTEHEAWLELSSGIRHGTISSENLDELLVFLEGHMPRLAQKLQQKIADGLLTPSSGMSQESSSMSALQSNQDKLDALMGQLDGLAAASSEQQLQYAQMITLLKHKPEQNYKAIWKT